LLRDAQYDLFVRMPQFSARFAATAWHGVCAGALFVALPVGLELAPTTTLLAIHGTATLIFFCCVALRICALSAARPIVLPRIQTSAAKELPVYSILVALYREKEVVSQLLVALGRIEWPRSKLEIKLVCEADDRETIDVLRAHRLHPCVEIVEVPPGQPRTKPKALQYALPLCSGDYVVLYDAEDRPHPMQLMEAWQRFQASDETLACVQAPLVVTNAGASMISRMFAFEYAGLFRGMLPWLSQCGLIFPLGGTSNHFRRDALQDVGGWDSHNITEDADLGLRLARFGYRAETISCPTLEDGPETLKTWLPQRTRWFKGWIQTWLVHMRNPFQLLRDLGLWSFIVSQILFLGMVASAVVHPVLVGTILYTTAKLLLTGSAEFHETFLALVDVANVASGYGAFIAICAYTLSRFEKQSLWKVLLFTPVYWVMLSVAAWWALWEFYRRPHHWHKTPHRKARPIRRYPIGEDSLHHPDAAAVR
jgi:cellulose synthase/poly-beta-1,6-N-acetylglucosamine synthase-like glycosyltransferase